MEKPTIEQVAWVFEKIIENAEKGGTYRYLIYDRMGFGPEAYVPLMGGIYINNELTSKKCSCSGENECL